MCLFKDSSAGDRQKGNVLFLILIAVALFAALSYAITSSTRGGNTQNMPEKDQAKAARLLNFSSTMQATVQRLMTVKGAAFTDLKFNTNTYKSKDGTILYGMGTPADPSLYVFHPSGGGVIPLIFADMAIDCTACTASNLASGHATILWVNAPNTGTTQSDAFLFVTNLTDANCLAVNKILGISSIPAVASNSYWTYMPGTTSPPVLTQLAGVTTADTDILSKNPAFCLRANNTGRNGFFSLLKAY